MSIGPSRPLALEKPETIDLKQAARYFGQRGEPDAATASSRTMKGRNMVVVFIRDTKDKMRYNLVKQAIA